MNHMHTYLYHSKEDVNTLIVGARADTDLYSATPTLSYNCSLKLSHAYSEM